VIRQRAECVGLLPRGGIGMIQHLAQKMNGRLLPLRIGDRAGEERQRDGLVLGRNQVRSLRMARDAVTRPLRSEKAPLRPFERACGAAAGCHHADQAESHPAQQSIVAVFEQLAPLIDGDVVEQETATVRAEPIRPLGQLILRCAGRAADIALDVDLAAVAVDNGAQSALGGVAVAGLHPCMKAAGDGHPPCKHCLLEIRRQPGVLPLIVRPVDRAAAGCVDDLHHDRRAAEFDVEAVAVIG
jgi:hypothetical protein